MTITCFRCGRAPRDDEPLIPPPVNMPAAWEGPPAVCPGCQYAEWHPHCTSVRVESGYGARLDLEAIARGETVTVEVDGAPVVFRSLDDVKALPEGEIGRCEYIDLDVSWIDDADPPAEWRCPECGGTQFEGVHRDYQAAGLKYTSFATEIEEDDDV